MDGLEGGGEGGDTHQPVVSPFPFGKKGGFLLSKAKLLLSSLRITGLGVGVAMSGYKTTNPSLFPNLT